MMAHLSDLGAARGAPSYVRDRREAERQGLYVRVFKRSFDVAAVLAAAVFVVPLVMLLALLVSLDGGRPFYWQDRVGRGGRIFRIWKLRSMDVDADRLLEAHLAADPAARAEWDRKIRLYYSSFPVIKDVPCEKCRRVLQIRVFEPPALTE